MIELTQHGIQLLIQNSEANAKGGVVVQVIKIKSVKDRSKYNRKFLISCGENCCLCVILSSSIKDEKIRCKPVKITVIKDRDNDFIENEEENIIKLESAVQPLSLQNFEEDKREENKVARRANHLKIMAGGELARGSLADNYAPIIALNPFNLNWIIEAKVTHISSLFCYSNEEKSSRKINETLKSGKLFNMELADQCGGQIFVTCFNSTVEKFYGKIQKGLVYRLLLCL